RPGAVDARAAPGEAAFTGPRRARHVVFADPHGQAAAPAPAEPLPAATDSATADAGEARAAGAPPGVRDRTAAVIGAASRPRTPVWPGSRPYAADTRQPGFAPGRGATAPADDEHARARP